MFLAILIFDHNFIPHISKKRVLSLPCWSKPFFFEGINYVCGLNDEVNMHLMHFSYETNHNIIMDDKK